MKLALSWALRAFQRDLRYRELRILAVAVLVAVGSMTAVGLFTERVANAMQRQGAELIAGDLLLRSAEPLPAAVAEQARSLGLQTTTIIEFPSVILGRNEGVQLVAVKAVSEGYPLRGTLRIADSPDGVDVPASARPTQNQAWLEPRLFALLGIEAGDVFKLGELDLVAAKALAYEPDRPGGWLQLSPRVLIAAEQLPQSGLLSAGSRARYKAVFSGDTAQLAAMRDWLSTQDSAWVIQTAQDARPELRAALDKAQNFLGLAAVVTILLAGTAIAVASAGFAAREADFSALSRCLGATQQLVLVTAIIRVLLMALLGIVTGWLLGYLGHLGLVEMLRAYYDIKLSSAGFSAYGTGALAAIIALLGFGLPPVLRLREVPVLRVLRRDLGWTSPSAWVVGLSGTIALAGLVVWQAGDVKLALGVLLGTMGALLALAALAVLLVRGLAGLRRGTGGIWRYGFANLARYPMRTVVQLVAFGIGITALLLLVVVRSELLSAWQAELPADTPNHFLINIRKDQVSDIKHTLNQRDISVRGVFPMLRARLLRINEQTVKAENFEDPAAKRLATREFNLSFSQQLPAENKVVAGAWWRDQDLQGWSVEYGLAQRLGISLGDTLVFKVADSEVSATVTSLREVRWDSFEVNFFVMGPPAQLDDLPANYISAFYLPASDADLIVELARQFPAVTTFDVTVLLKQVREIIDRASLAIEFVFGFTLLAGFVVLYAALHASSAARIHENAVLRALGATRRQLFAAQAAEFSTMGAAAGLIAAVSASLVGWWVASRILDVPYRGSEGLWILAVLGAAIGVGAVGLYALRKVLDVPPWQSLRAAE